jgi:hypothetical protein
LQAALGFLALRAALSDADPLPLVVSVVVPVMSV